MKYLLLFFSVICSLGLNAQSNNCFPKIKKKYHFKLIRKWGIKIDTNVIKTNGIYLYINKDSTKYYYIRHFDNGKYYASGEYSKLPDSAQLENFNYGVFGEYAIKDSSLYLEIYTGGYVKYQLWKYTVVKDSIFNTKLLERRFNGIEKVVFPPIIDTTEKSALHFIPIILRSKPFW